MKIRVGASLRSSELVFGGPRTGPGGLGLPGFQLLAVQVFRSSKTLLCVPLEGNQDLPPGCTVVPDGPSLHPLPSLTSTCGHLPFGAQGGASRLKPIP